MSIQISFFSLMNFFQPTFIALTLCTEHFFRHWVFKGKAAEASVYASSVPGHGSSGTHPVFLPCWGHFYHVVFLVVHVRGPRTVSSNLPVTEHLARCPDLPGAQ